MAVHNKEDKDRRLSSSNLNNKGIIPSTKSLRSEVPILPLRQHQDCSATAQGVWTVIKPQVVTVSRSLGIACQTETALDLALRRCIGASSKSQMYAKNCKLGNIVPFWK